MANETRHWSDWINILAGIWLFVSPWALVTTGAGAWNAWIVGVIVALFGFLALSDQRAEWVNVAAAVWLFFSPWFLGFAGGGGQVGVPSGTDMTASMAWNCWILAVIVFAAGLAGARTAHPEAVTHRV